MLLKQILGDKFDLKNFSNVETKNIKKNSKEVEKGDVYFSLSDDYQKSFERCKEAFEKGAVAVFSNFDLPFENSFKCEDCRDLFAHSCANFYDRACDDLKIVAISGTNGKTSTSHIISEMLKRNGKNAGVIGTNGVFYNGKILPCPLTTPDADFLHKTFFDMRKEGVEYVVMEVSAHAIAQKRVNGIMFELGVLTNITQDHLDYFKTFENYKKTKLSFFCKEHMKKAIVCADDRSARKLIDDCDVPVISYGIKNPSDTFAIDICCSINGSRFVGNVCDDFVEIKTNLVGEYNVYNSLAALSVCHSFGLNPKELALGLNFINPVEGRFNVINLSGTYVVIDYAHSPDGLLNVLKTAKSLTDKNLYVIFGCGGNRDKDKRPKMGKIACEYADYICLTDDNPRLEDSLDIIHDIEKGMDKPHFVEPDRTKAIKKILDISKPGDIVIIAGKGAEKYQEIGTEKKEYNDFDAVYKYFKDSNPFKSRSREFYDC